MIPIILSIIFPGLGQIYYKKYFKGILMALLSLLPFFYPFILIWSIIDSIRLSTKSGIEKFSTKETIIGVVIFFLIVPLTLFAFVMGSSWTYDQFTNQYVFPKNTRSELNQIRMDLDRHFKYEGKLPETLTEFVEGNPMREPYRVDTWSNPYRYELIDSNGFIITSAGSDRQFDTEDDIRISYRLDVVKK